MKAVYALLFIGVLAIGGCGRLNVAEERSAEIQPTQAATLSTTSTVEPTTQLTPQTQATDDWVSATSTGAPTPEITPTSALANRAVISGTWRHITTANGLCTNTPLLIGANPPDGTAVGVIGTGLHTFCYPDPNGNEWVSMQLPEGNRVISAYPVRMMPPAGFDAMLDTGTLCQYPLYDAKSGPTVRIPNPQWDCASLKDKQIVWPRDTNGQRILSVVAGDFRLADGVLLSTYGQPLERFDIHELVGSQQARTTSMAKSFQVHGVTVDENVWVGTYEHGIVVINANTREAKRITTQNGLSSNTIRDIDTQGEDLKQGRSPDIWVATDKGVAHFDGTKWTSYTTKDGLPSDDVRGVSAMRGQGVWAATAKGAAYLDRATNTWIDLTSTNELAQHEMTGVLFIPFVGSDHSEIWFSTSNDGLVTFTPHSN